MSQIDVLFVGGGSYVFGAEKINLSIISGAYRSGLKTLCTVTGWNDGKYIEELKSIGVDYKEIYLGWYYLKKLKWTLDSIIHAPKAFYLYHKLLRAYNPSITYHYSIRTIFLLAPLIKGKIIYHVHDESFATKQGKYLLNFIKNRVDLFIACSDYIGDKLVIHGVSASKIKVIHNFAKIEKEFSRNIKEAQREPVINLGIVGQILPHKGHQILIQALEIVKKSGFDFTLQIFGDGDALFIDTLKKSIELLALDSKVFWRGYVNSRFDIYNNLDVVIVPSIIPEPFGLVAIEPSSYKVPAIVSAAGGLDEIVIDGITGLKFHPGDAEDLASKIIYVLQNPQILAKMGSNALELYSKIYSENSQVEKVIELLKTLR